MNWKQFINIQKQEDYFKNLQSFVDKQRQNNIVYPAQDKVFACFNYFEPEQTKVVIVGQDPYYSPLFANGLAFAVNKGVTTPKSLINIFKELKDDLGIEKTNADLIDWAKQGILLLNRVMTVAENQPNSHKNKGWETFTTNVIKFLNDSFSNIVFVLWGNNAQELIPYIDQTKHLIIKSSHPSPLGYYKSFKGSKPFSKINKYLIEHKKEPIKW